MKTTATNKKVRELVQAVIENTLKPRPEFQRRIVWTRDDKIRFLETVLKKYPFPEIYIADGEVNLETGDGTQLLVDGQQRVSTLVQYFTGEIGLPPDSIPAYKDLPNQDKSDFLQYDVCVRDLGAASREEIIEVFRRINATSYSLQEIEINNAIYTGKLKQFAESLLELEIFNLVFTTQDFRRMGDLRFILSLISGLMYGYTNRDDNLENLLSTYNDEFLQEKEVSKRFISVVDFLTECGFSKRSRIWKKADLYSAFIELDQLINFDNYKTEPSMMIDLLERFYSSVNQSEDANQTTIQGIYYKASLQASNDRSNRLRRGIIINGVMKNDAEPNIIQNLVSNGLINEM